ncbi:MAG: oxidoreductase [Limisphaerales bacterium]
MKQSMQTTLSNKTALVTGVSSGIGREIAQRLAGRGARVFGAVRDPMSTKPIHGVEIVRMDVTDDASVSEAIQSILQKAGSVHILVNNAGYSLMGALEETSLAEARQQFETNFFGVLRVTNAVLPEMRQAAQGRIVNISSVVGFIPAPYMGIYAASKHAVEGYTWTLDHEVRRFGVRAVLVEPAFTKSKISHSGKEARIKLKEYAVHRQRMKEAVQKGIENGDDPRNVAEVVCRAVSVKLSRLRYPVGKAVSFSRLRRFVPDGLFDRSIRKRYHLD